MKAIPCWNLAHNLCVFDTESYKLSELIVDDLVFVILRPSDAHAIMKQLKIFVV